MTTPKFQPSPTITEPFLWVHIALLLGLPWLLGLSLNGLAVGDPLLPGGLEILLIATPAIALPLWWQWQKPLSPFSVWLAAKPINELSSSQLKILALLKDVSTPSQTNPTPKQILNLIKQLKFTELAQSITLTWNPTGWVAIACALSLYSIFRHLYQIAPLAADFAPFPPVLRLLGILWALVFLAIASLVLQMGVSAARLLLVSPQVYEQTAPLAANQVKANFTSFGMRLSKFFDFTITETETTSSKTKTASGWLSFELNENNPLFKLWEGLVNQFNKKPIQTKVTREEVPTKASTKVAEVITVDAPEVNHDAEAETTAVSITDTVQELKATNFEATVVVTEASDQSTITNDPNSEVQDQVTESTDTNAEAVNNMAEANVSNTEEIDQVAEVPVGSTEATSTTTESPTTDQSETIPNNVAESDLEQNPETANNSEDQEWV